MMKSTVPTSANAPNPIPIPMPAFAAVSSFLGGGELVGEAEGVAVVLVEEEVVMNAVSWVEDIVEAVVEDEEGDEEEDEDEIFLPCVSTAESVMLKETLWARGSAPVSDPGS